MNDTAGASILSIPADVTRPRRNIEGYKEKSRRSQHGDIALDVDQPRDLRDEYHTESESHACYPCDQEIQAGRT